MISIDIIAGARPNFMKIGPIIHTINKINKKTEKNIKYRLIHTGQHYDKAMSESFFQQLNLPEPNLNLGAGGGTQAEQTAAIMVGYEKAIKVWKPDLCIVVGDVTSTMACAIVAKKEGVKVAHVEGGIRSGDMTMPEEINRIVTDSITDFFFTTSEVANQNLTHQGVRKDQIFFVGNTMIDSLLGNLERLQEPTFYCEQNLRKEGYLVATLHRPSNVDDPVNLFKLLSIIDAHCGNKKVIFPMHPRTKKIYDGLGLSLINILIMSPMPYLEFIYTIKNSAGIITDSGGITEEATVLGIPCMTLRDSTERPETVTIGTNEMVGTNPENIISYIEKMVKGDWKKGGIPELWDGKTAERIVEVILSF
ncbi:MAG: UDP-N-acetylglucosamine 2-epimerase (non-hydrolyzing) [Saprospiraceae bacterium]|nr:UDP-N-acetylglucosamine 2-epimerase (non-hydrolyzing) [Saprospiraceae bacterium]